MKHSLLRSFSFALFSAALALTAGNPAVVAEETEKKNSSDNSAFLTEFYSDEDLLTEEEEAEETLPQEVSEEEAEEIESVIEEAEEEEEVPVAESEEPEEEREPESGNSTARTYTLSGDDQEWNSFFSSGSGLVNDTNEKTFNVDGTSVTVSKRIKLNKATGSYDSNSIRFTIEEGYEGALTIYAVSSNGSVGATLNVFKKDGTATGANRTMAGSTTDPVKPYVFDKLAAGEYYIASNDSSLKPANIYYIKAVETDPNGSPEPAERKAWDEVTVPSVSKAERQEDGTVNVSFSAEIGYDGADGGRLFMMQDGFELSSQPVTEAGVKTFQPEVNGDLTFRIVISRAGCPDKQSADYVLEGYTLPPEMPAITWLTNLGDGAVYVDWNNVDADQGCTVSYRKEQENYTVAETGNRKGNCIIRGLTSGKEYTVQVTANDAESGTSTYERTITVGEPVQEWYADDFGSASSGKIKVGETEFAVKSYNKLYPISLNRAPDVTDGNGEITMTMSSKNGKIADSEEGVQAYYTRLNPNTEDFRLTATFELLEGLEVDNQCGFGIYAFDAAGLGTKDAKYMNSVAVGNFKLRSGGGTLYHGNGVRVVTGYISYDPTSTEGSGRVLDNTGVFATQPEDTSTLETGKKFTYTLEKTDEGFRASMAGDETPIIVSDAHKIMKQEDGSIVVAVVSARCNAKVTDIHFEKTEGSAGGDGEKTVINPEVTVYSSSETSSLNYEFTVGSNVPGSVELYHGNELLGSGTTDNGTVVKLPVTLWNRQGTNELYYVFKPDPGTPDLSDYDEITGYLSVFLHVRGMENQLLYTSPQAQINGLGTKEQPADLQSVLTSALPGQTIVMLDGTYEPEEDLIIPRNVSGEENRMITLMAEHPGKVTVSGNRLTSSSSLFTIVGSWWHVYGIEFCNTPAKAVSVAGNHNIVELCTMHHAGNSGLQISRYSGEPNDQEMWPSWNLIKNCEAHDNCDPGRNDADGFAAKLTCGEGNRFYGCISHHNIDDGWDLYAKSTTGEIGTVVIENSVAYSNGWLSEDDPSDPGTSFGEGNGFKLGGENIYGGHQLINSVSFNNYAKGITSNSCPDNVIRNCTVYNNSLNGKSYNVSLYTKASNRKAWVADGVLSIAANQTTKAELGDSNGVLYSLKSPTNYFYDGKSSFNNQGQEATADWFESVDVSVKPTRNEDGTINMHGLLVLNDQAPSDTGARLNASQPSVQPDMKGNPISRIANASISGQLSKDSLTDEVREATGASTIEELKTWMMNSVRKKNSELNQSEVFEITPEVSFDGGRTWVIADQETFPEEGIDIVIPYPESASLKKGPFAVSHIVTSSINGQKAGTLEYPQVTPADEGLICHIFSASPFAVGWKAEVLPREIRLNPSEMSLSAGTSKQVSVSFSPSDTTETDVIWSSDHPEIACVDQYGTVTAVTEGSAVITAASAVVSLSASCTVTVTEQEPEEKGTEMHRLYNPNSGEHFFTASGEEKDVLVSAGWKYEGIGFKAPAESDMPILRLYNPNEGKHHYTASEEEWYSLIEKGWKDEGLGWYGADEGKGIPMYRLYNPNAGDHMYTLSAEERDFLIKAGWNDEGIGFWTAK